MWHQGKIDNLSNHLQKEGYFVIDNLLPNNLFDQLSTFFNISINQFTPAQIGKGLIKNRNAKFRKDHILWLSSDVLTKISMATFYNGIQNEVRQKLFSPIKRYEAHFSQYKKGDYYVKHSDRHEKSPHRILTSVFYLNTVPEKNGGELRIYRENKDIIPIQPVKNKFVIFLSELEHEVRPTTASHRNSLTAWFRDDIL